MKFTACVLFGSTVLAVSALAGCAGGPRGVEVHPGSGWGPEGKTPLTQAIALIADTQIHESRGVASRYFNRSGDEFVPVTLRTGQQVIGAADVLLYAMERAKVYPLVLHAGDAIDVSCATEWELFIATMAAAGRPDPGPSSWLFTPGNHDGFLTGNMYPKDDGRGRLYVKSYWSNVCNAGQLYVDEKNRYSHIPKEEVVERYVAMLLKHKNTSKNGMHCNVDSSLCWATRIRKGNFQWTSYVVQRVRLPSSLSSDAPIYALLVDSSDFPERPYLSPSGLAGLRAGVSMDQLRSLQDLISDLPSQARFFLVAHHPFDDWGIGGWSAEARALWGSVNGDARSLRFLVSAHTHEGSLRIHGGKTGPLTELNIGSLSDAPVYLRSLWFEQDSQGMIGFRSQAIPLSATLSSESCPGSMFPSMEREFDYDVRGQDTESDRASKWPAPIRYTSAFLSAMGHFFKFWSGKHDELRPQLLAYADIVERSVPPDTEFVYFPFGELDDQNRVIRPTRLQGGAGIAKALRENANCRTGQRFCSVQAKGNLLLALEKYFWFESSASPAVKQHAHRLRLCLALAATAESPHPDGSESKKVDLLSRAIGVEWAGRLLPSVEPAEALGHLR